MPVDHTKNVIEARNVFFKYSAEDVLKDCTLNIHKGDYLGIVGPNGSGKTTFIKIMLGLLKPSSGEIRIFGKDISEFKEWSKIGYVPQKKSFENNFPATVKEVVAMPAKKLEDAERALEIVGMQSLKNRLIGNLSGGQQQKVFIARALVNNPEIIFLDEPTANIDGKSQNDFYNIIKKLNEKMGITVVLVSHDIERITKEAMHIACVDHALVCHNSAEEFLKESRVVNAFHRHD